MQLFPCWRFLQATQLLALPGSEQPPRHWSWQHWPLWLHALCLQLSRHTEEKQRGRTKRKDEVNDCTHRFSNVFFFTLISISIKIALVGRDVSLSQTPCLAFNSSPNVKKQEGAK